MDASLLKNRDVLERVAIVLLVGANFMAKRLGEDTLV